MASFDFEAELAIEGDGPFVVAKNDQLQPPQANQYVCDGDERRHHQGADAAAMKFVVNEKTYGPDMALRAWQQKQSCKADGFLLDRCNHIEIVETIGIEPILNFV